MAKPLQLIRCEKDGRFVVGEDALERLNSLKGPLAVVAVCGRARQGKSFILNQIAGNGLGVKGFEVGPTHRPCTKGLWIWSDPIEHVTPDGRKCNLLLLDTEGIDAYDQTGQYSVQIFSLAVLLSSMFIYNQMGGIDEASLERLSLVTEMTKHIQVKAGKTGSDTPASASELGVFSPYFVWLLRDFYLDLSEDGYQIPPSEYLEIALRPTVGTNEACKAKNQIRDSIRSLFPQRECVTLVRPVNDERQLQQMANLDPSQMRPEFQEGVAGLMEHIFLHVEPKSVAGLGMTGPVLAGLASAYTDALNKGAVPTISTAWQSVAEGQCRLAMQEGEARWREVFHGHSDVQAEAANEGLLRAAFEDAWQATLLVFDDIAVGDVETRKAFRQRLHDDLSRQFEQFKERCYAQANARCAELVSDASQRLHSVARDAPEAGGLEMMIAAILSEIGMYMEAADGPEKCDKLVQLMANQCLPLCQDMARHQQEAAAAEAAAAELCTTALRREVADATAAEEHAREECNRALRERDDALRQCEVATVQCENATKREADAREEAANARADMSNAREEVGIARGEAAEAKMDANQAHAHLKAAEHKASLAISAQEAAETRAINGEARITELDTMLAETQTELHAKEIALNVEMDKVARLESLVRESQDEMGRLQDEVSEAEQKRRTEGERSMAAQSALHAAEAAKKALSAELALEKQAKQREQMNAATAAKREMALRKQFESAVMANRASSAAYSNCLAQWQNEAEHAAAGRLADREQMTRTAAGAAPGGTYISSSDKYTFGNQSVSQKAEPLNSITNHNASGFTTPRASDGIRAKPPNLQVPAYQMTTPQLKWCLTEAGYGNDIQGLGLRPRKKDLVEIYQRKMPNP